MKDSGESVYLFALEDFFNLQLNKILLDIKWEDVGSEWTGHAWRRKEGLEKISHRLQANRMVLDNSLSVFEPQFPNM